jgi:hypothetical protein
MKHRKKSGKRSKSPQAKSGLNLYKVQYQLIHVHKLPFKDKDNPKAAPQETRTTTEHFRNVLERDKIAAAALVQSLAEKDSEIHVGLITEIAVDVVGSSAPKAVSKGHKHSKKGRKSHGKKKVRKAKVGKVSA